MSRLVFPPPGHSVVHIRGTIWTDDPQAAVEVGRQRIPHAAWQGMRHPPQHELDEQLRARLTHALGQPLRAPDPPAMPDPPPMPDPHVAPRRSVAPDSSTAVHSRRHEAQIMTVLRHPDAVPDPTLTGATGPTTRRLPSDLDQQEPDDRVGRVGSGSVTRAGPGAALVGQLVQRIPFGRRHLVVVVVIASLAVVMAGWALLQARAVPLDEPGPGEPGVAFSTDPAEPSATTPAAAETQSIGPGPGAPPARDPAASTEPQTIQVHVVGAVHKPGVVELTEGARVGDALAAAGGVTPAAVLGELNLAQPVGDGQQVFVSASTTLDSVVRDPQVSTPRTAAGAGPGPGPGAGSSSAAGGADTVDLNTATAAELEQLPGVGPVTAQAIVAWREQHGRFTRIEELQEVDGIGPKTFARLAPHVRV